MDIVDMKMRERVNDIKHLPYQLLFYDEKGRRVFTDYTSVEPNEEYINDYYNWLKRLMPRKAERIRFIVIVKRRVLFTMRIPVPSGQ